MFAGVPVVHELSYEDATMRSLFLQTVVGVAILSSGCTSEEEAPPDSISDTGASGEDASIDTANASDVSDGSGALVQCGGAGGICAAPCTARYLFRYSRELDCISAREEWEPRPDAPGLLFFSCESPDAQASQVVSCFCNEGGECGVMADLPEVPADSGWSRCDASIEANANDALSTNRYCPVGTFD
jgi:hypothetical protein